MGSRELPRTLTPLSDIDIRALAEAGDPRDVFLSVYLPMGAEDMNRSFLEDRLRTIRDAVPRDLRADLRDTLELLGDLPFHDPFPGERGRVLFASAPQGMLEAYRIGVAPERRVVLDNSPFILPLAAMMDDYEDYGILLMDSQEARLYEVRSNVIEEVGSERIDLMNRHKKGGMSQKRFNRLRRGAIDAFVDEVVRDLDAIDLRDMRGLVVAGPGGAKGRLVDALPGPMRDKVIGVVDADMDVHPGVLMERGGEAAEADEDLDEAAVMDGLRKAVYRDELAAVGIENVWDTLVQGRVETLVVLESLSLPGWMCEECRVVSEGPGPCGCGGTASGVDLVNEMVELATRTSSAVEMVETSEWLREAGGVAAVLRY